MRAVHRLALLLLAAASSFAAAAQDTRVIVKFRSDAATLREHALSASSASAQAATLDARAAALGARRGLALKHVAGVGERSQVVRVEGLWAHELAARLAADPQVEYAEPDRRRRRLAVPNDPLFLTGGAGGPAVGQWYLRAPAGEVVSSIDAVRAWDITKGSDSVIVAVLDTGTRTDHPDLQGKLVPGYDMVSEAAVANDGSGRDSDPTDPGDWITQAEINANQALFRDCTPSSSSWHGTQTAGIVGAATDNGAGMAGAGWNIKVMPVRVLGKCFGYTSDIIAGMRWAAGLPVAGVPSNPNPAKVLNMSLGSADACSQAEADAVAAVRAAGAVIIAAAGNSAGQAAGSPANCAGVIGVAAVRHIGTKVGFSDVGPQLSIAAPGGNCVNLSGACLYPILTTTNSGLQGPGAHTWSDGNDPSVGTSFSSPLVAATAALMLSASPTLTPDGLRATLMASARPFPSSGVADDPNTGPIQTCQAPSAQEQLQCYCTTTTCGAGLLDAGSAVAAVAGLRALIGVAPAAPQAGQAITFDASGSTAAAGRSIASRLWTLVDGGGIATSFVGAVDGASATLTPTGAGTLTVRLTVTDSAGASASAQQSVAVGAAPGSSNPAPSATGGSGGGGGGGALSWPWLAALAAGTAALRRRRPD